MSLLALIKGFFGLTNGAPKRLPGDRTLSCEDCQSSFIFDEGEQRFFKAKGFTDPKRCPKCRQKVRSHVRKKFRRDRRPKRHAGRRENHLIDGRSPYADER